MLKSILIKKIIFQSGFWLVSSTAANQLNANVGKPWSMKMDFNNNLSAILEFYHGLASLIQAPAWVSILVHPTLIRLSPCSLSHTEDYNGYDTDYADITDLYLPLDCKPSHDVLLYKTQQYKIMYNIIPIHDNKSTVYYTQRGTHSLPMQGRYGVSYCTYETSLLPSFLSCCIQYCVRVDHVI